MSRERDEYISTIFNTVAPIDGGVYGYEISKLEYLHNQNLEKLYEMAPVMLLVISSPLTVEQKLQ